MGFKKGQSGNPSGRKKGVPNKMSAAQREYLRDFLFANKKKFEAEMKDIKGKNYLQTYLALMQYTLPKPAVSELKEVPKLEEFIAMTREERQAAVDEIQESMKREQA